MSFMESAWGFAVKLHKLQAVFEVLNEIQHGLLDVDIRAPWGWHHLLQDSLFLSLNMAACDFGCMFEREDVCRRLRYTSLEAQASSQDGKAIIRRN